MAKPTNGRDLTRHEDGDGETEIQKKGENERPGAFLPGDFKRTLLEKNFATVKTVMVGNPEDGRWACYMGQLVGPGANVKVEAPDGTENELPTWVFHPIDASTGEVLTRVTHVIPAPHQVHAACDRIYKHAQATQQTAIVGIEYEGMGKTRKGRQLNNFSTYEAYQPRANGQGAKQLAPVAHNPA